MLNSNANLKNKYGLEQAFVDPQPKHAESTHNIIGALLGGYLSEHVTENLTIGLGYAKTLSASLPSIEPRERQGVKVVSLLGGLTRVSGINPSEFAWRVADRL